MQILARAIHNLKYSYPTFKYMGEYVDIDATILRNCTQSDIEDIAINEKSGVKRASDKVYRKLLNNRSIIDGTDVGYPVLSRSAVQLLKGVGIQRRIDDILISLPVRGVFDLVIKDQRSGVTECKSVGITDKTKFSVMSNLRAYGTEKYSIAVSSNDYGFALMARYSKKGIKGDASLYVSILTENEYFIDDASKYIDISQFVEGIS